MMFVCSNSLAANQKSYKPIRTEVSLLWVIPYLAGVITAGRYVAANIIELEALVLIAPDEAYFSGNFSLNLPTEKRFIPFATIGYGVCIHGVGFFNVGGGIKIRLKEKLGIRAQGMYWSNDVSGIGIFAGISYFF
ncbi:MAG: hypothetical protein JSV96_13180 [Candidatus Aminicenantes bacterium]|nr:MAG: hypothetical protein JSV96_13180 [Candidatus Aminicenantes bacterium]